MFNRGSQNISPQVRERESCDTGATDPEESCERKHDCRKCANFTTNADCLDSDDYVSKYCEWTGTVYEITTEDILFVVGTPLCQLATSLGLLCFDWNKDATLAKCCTVICLVAEIGFTVWKLFPTMYFCRTLACAKLTHNCIMTMANFPFSFFELAIANQKADQSGVGRCTFTTAAKGAGLILEFAYVVYDLNKQTSEALGAGTYFLIVIACLSDTVLVLGGCALMNAYECGH